MTGRKAAVEHAAGVDRLAVVAIAERRAGAGLRRRGRAGVDVTAAARVRRRRCPITRVDARRRRGRRAWPRASAAGGAARRLAPSGRCSPPPRPSGAAGRLLDDACALRRRAPAVRAHDRQQPGAPPPAGRHVRPPGELWSTVLYAAAALDDELPEAPQTAAVAKAYVARAAREVAHGAMQVFGGIAFTEEHPAHRFLRRIVVREQQFGDAAHHERELGRMLAAQAPAGRRRRRSACREPLTGDPDDAVAETGFNDPTAQRLERDHHRRRPGDRRAAAGRRPARPALADAATSRSSPAASRTSPTASPRDAGEVILRRPPLGHILPTAHDMAREYRVLSALDGTAVPVPRTLHLGDADSALGAPFYVMERVVGHICRNALPAGLRRRRPSSARAIGEALVDVLAEPAHRRPGRGRPGRVRPAGRASWSASCAAGRSSGRRRGATTCRRSTRCATTSCATLPDAARRRDRRTATTGSTTRSCTPRGPAGSSRCSTGR